MSEPKPMDPESLAKAREVASVPVLVIKRHGVEAEELPADASTISIGQWYWLARKPGVDKDGKRRRDYDSLANDWVEAPERDLVCAMRFGSNYVTVENMRGMSWRIHFDEVAEKLTYEPNAEAVGAAQADQHKVEIAALMQEINDRTAELGLRPDAQLGEGRNEVALARLDGSTSADQHKAALARAREELPELFERIELEHKLLARTMAASTLPMRAQVGDLRDLTKAIDARVMNIDLYAGLSEELVKIRGGDPADYATPLAVRQRLLYMDEECVAMYRAGGMRFSEIEDFDRWVARRDRWRVFMPEDRCVVAFRIRREMRRYDGHADLARMLRFWAEAQQDMRTYLYIRNGEQVYRLSTRFDFGERLFPESSARDLDEPMMMAHHGQQVITRREWEDLDEDYQDRWEPMTPDSVWFDDAMSKVKTDVEHYNRVAIILQGLFDRSMCLHPHPPAKLWTPDGFNRAIRLVFDSDHAIAPPDRPDFLAYWKQVNASLAPGSATYGQRPVWEKQMRNKYGWDRYGCDLTPYNLRSPGLAEIARVYKVHPNTGHCTYRWLRNTYTWDYHGNRKQKAQIAKVPIDKVFNLDGYKPGDFRRFFADPRTRAEYMQWAPYLLTGEDYHAGKCEVVDAYTG